MSELDAVAEAIRSADPKRGDWPWSQARSSEIDRYSGMGQAAIDVLRPTVSTVEQLDALPVGSVVRSGAGTIACRFDSTRGVVFGDDRTFPWRKLKLSAVVLWRPDQQAVS